MKNGAAPGDLCSVSAAARAVGITPQGLSYWIESGQVRTYGRGGRRALLVSLAEAQAVAERKAGSVSQAEARRMLGMDIHTVRLLCASGDLPSHQVADRGDIEVDREAVLRLCADRSRQRRERETRFLSVEAAAQQLGWPRWVLDKFITEGRIPIVPGERGAKLIERDFLARFVEEATENPDPCPTCGEPLPPGRKVHNGKCAATQAGTLRRDPAFVAKVNARLEKRLSAVKRSRGLTDVYEVARLLDREPVVIWRHARALGLGEKHAAPGGVRILLTASEVDEIRKRIDQAFERWFKGDLKRRADWYHARYRSMKLYGRYAKQLAAKKGRTLGKAPFGPSPLLLTEDRLRQIVQLHARGRSQREIARRLGMSRGNVEYALRKIRAAQDRVAETENGLTP